MIHTYTVSDARYSKNKKVVRTPSTDGYLTDAGSMAKSLSNGRWSNKEHGYIMSIAASMKFEKYLELGYMASSWDGQVTDKNGNVIKKSRA